MKNLKPSCKKVKLSLFAIIWLFSIINLISTNSYAQTVSLSEIETWKKLIEETKFEDLTKGAGSIVNMWNVVTDKATGVPLSEKYKKLYNDAQNQLSTARNLIGQSKAHYDRREFDQAKNDLLNAQKYLKVAQSTNQNAIQVWEGLLDSGDILAKGLQKASDYSLSALASLVPGASSVVTGFLTSRDFIADSAMDGLGEASKNAIANIAINAVFNQFTGGKSVKGLGEIDMATLAKRLSTDPNFRGRVENQILQDLSKHIAKDQASKITKKFIDQFSIYVAKLPNQSPQPQQDVTRLNGIKQAFRDILGRDADTGGLNGYYNSGLSIDSIRQSLLNSNECRQGKGGECARRYASTSTQPSSSSQPTRLSEGTLCRLKGQSQVYVISGGKKCYIPDPETFNARGFKWDQIKEIDQTTFNSILTGSALTSVVKAAVAQPQPNDANRLNGIKQAFRDILGREADTGGLTNYYNGGLSIDSIRQSLFNSNECRQGKGGECAKRYDSANPQPSSNPQPTRLSEGTLCRLKGQTQVYVISGGRKCYIPDPETFDARGFKWDRVMEIDQATFNNISTGNPLNSVKKTTAQSPTPSQTQRVNPQVGISTNSSSFGGTSISGEQGVTFYTHGNGFSPNSTVSFHVKKPDGVEFPPGDFKTDNSGNFGQTYTSRCDSPVGTYHIWAVDKATGKGSNTITETIAKNAKCVQIPPQSSSQQQAQPPRVTPQVGISTSSSGSGGTSVSGEQGVTFYTRGNGFSPNSTASFHVKKPDGVEFPPGDFKTDNSGNFGQTYTSRCDSPVGIYHIWAVDKATGKGSNTITETITKNAKCGQTSPQSSSQQQAQPPRINPQVGISTNSSSFGGTSISGEQGVTFYTHGNGFSPNSTASFHVKKPDGVEFPPGDFKTDNSGNFGQTYTSRCDSPVGTYHIWAVDKATGKGSNTITETISKNAKCK